MLLLDKALGVSSNTAVGQVKRIYNATKAGHTGTLDPLASGLLPICFGEATKFSSFMLEADKEYIATVQLGMVTSTYDAEGEIIDRSQVSITKSQLIECIQSFIGEILQQPPLYSALKVNGKPLYKYARLGQSVEVKFRTVNIRRLELVDFVEDKFTLKVLCSKGTYIRSLAHDIGQKLGCGAYLSGLIRTKTGNFSLNQATDFNKLSNLLPAELLHYLLPIDVLVEHLTKTELSEAQFNRVKNGHKCEFSLDTNEQVRVYYKNIFLGIAENENNTFLKPIRLCNTANL